MLKNPWLVQYTLKEGMVIAMSGISASAVGSVSVDHVTQQFGQANCLAS